MQHCSGAVALKGGRVLLLVLVVLLMVVVGYWTGRAGGCHALWWVFLAVVAVGHVRQAIALVIPAKLRKLRGCC